jgi:hypothetical protein
MTDWVIVMLLEDKVMCQFFNKIVRFSFNDFTKKPEDVFLSTLVISR